MHNKEEWNARITNMTVREGDVHDCDPVRQGHVSALLVTSSDFARESLASQFCSPTALTLGRFPACLSLCLCLCDWTRKHFGNFGGASQLQPRDIDTIYNFTSTSDNSSSIPVPRALPDCTPPPPPGLEGQALLDFHTTSRLKLGLCVLICIMVPPAPRRACLLHLLHCLPHSHRSVPPMWEHTPLALQLPT